MAGGISDDEVSDWWLVSEHSTRPGSRFISLSDVFHTLWQCQWRLSKQIVDRWSVFLKL